MRILFFRPDRSIDQSGLVYPSDTFAVRTRPPSDSVHGGSAPDLYDPVSLYPGPSQTVLATTGTDVRPIVSGLADDDDVLAAGAFERLDLSHREARGRDEVTPVRHGVGVVVVGDREL